MASEIKAAVTKPEQVPAVNVEEKSSKRAGQHCKIDKSDEDITPRGRCDVKMHHSRPFYRLSNVLILCLDKILLMMRMVCGPEPLKIDVSNAYAASQSRVLRQGMREVKLHIEGSWC